MKYNEKKTTTRMDELIYMKYMLLTKFVVLA